VLSLLANSNAIETGGYQISRSVRLRSSASAYFNRTPASAGNRKTWTWSGWVKNSSIGASYPALFAAGASGSNNTSLLFYSDKIRFNYQSGGSTVADLQTSAVYRDPAAWYHIVFVLDTTNATANNRMRLYVNGSEVTSFSARTNPSLNADYDISNTSSNTIGQSIGWGYFDGYLTEINFIDGQALTPSSFGETDANTGVWVAKKYVGSYGTNGFFLTFADNSAATSTTIGKDYSGNGNNWTPNNISVTAGTTYDSMLDVPAGNGYADGGNGRGNYAVINPLYAYGTLANGNLDYYTTTNYQGGYATMAVSGKIYFEVTCASPTGGGALVGFVKNASIVPSTTNFFTGTGFYGAIFSNTLNYYLNGSSDGLDHGNVTSSMLQFAVDADTGKCWVGSNNTWFDSGSPATGANPAWTISLSSGDLLFPAFCAGNSTYTLNVNFGQRPFSYTPPTGFKALNTTNL
ncbi:MAG: LamG-like jellyroll fold domain-containing protein, partial [Candidatus Nanopelagicaceae bacterium]